MLVASACLREFTVHFVIYLSMKITFLYLKMYVHIVCSPSLVLFVLFCEATYCLFLTFYCCSLNHYQQRNFLSCCDVVEPWLLYVYKRVSSARGSLWISILKMIEAAKNILKMDDKFIFIECFCCTSFDMWQQFICLFV